MTSPLLSVIICTRNPRPDYFLRVVAALRAQTLPVTEWELVVIDNGSTSPLASRFDLSWHTTHRILREEKLGLIPARIRGIAELTLFVDDDNVLDAAYLAEALAIGQRCPMLDTWGGQCLPEFEVEPDDDLAPFLPGLALRTCERDSWSNFVAWDSSHPFGAGMVVRRVAAEAYARNAENNPLSPSLGRGRAKLASGDDTDINGTACEMGLGCGVFRALVLTHLLRKERRWTSVPPACVDRPRQRMLPSCAEPSTPFVFGIEPARPGRREPGDKVEVQLTSKYSVRATMTPRSTSSLEDCSCVI